MMKVVRPRAQLVDRLLDARLGLDVERAGRLVEHQDRRVLQDGAGNGDALALAAGQLAAALAGTRVVAVALGEDEVLRRRGLGGGMDLVVASRSSRPMRMFSSIERLNRPASWNTVAIDWRSDLRVTRARVDAVDQDAAVLSAYGRAAAD